MALHKRKPSATVIALADAICWYCALALVAIVLLSSMRESPVAEQVKGKQLVRRPCEEIYIVGEGETLHMISDQCGDPFIVKRNPHIHDPDDVFPGLVIKLRPTKPGSR